MQRSFKDSKATLFLVSTPIGHLKDITFRAIETLKEVSAIFAEDTRTSIKLLNHYQIKKPLYSYHEHNKMDRMSLMIHMLEKGEHIALISDAGTPGISDPGYEIIKEVIAKDYHVVSIPGATALTTALVVSGLPLDSFTFIGFLPKKQSDLESKLSNYKTHKETLIIYESPKRVQKTLHQLFKSFGNRKIALCRELTKTYETIIRTDLMTAKKIDHELRGEYVLVIEGAKKEEKHKALDIPNLVKYYIDLGYDEKEAMKLCAKDKQIAKSEVYKVYKIK